MITKSTLFDTYAATSGHQRDSILKITQTIGASPVDYYFSMRPMPRGLNTGPIYPLLLGWGSLNEEVSIFTKQWQTSEIKLSLSDAPFFPNSTSGAIRLSSLLTNLNGATCQIYLWVDGITDIADCLKIFDGYILQSPEVSRDSLQFTAYDKARTWDVTLPLRVVGDVWADAPNTTLQSAIPLVYGYFNIGNAFGATGSGTGLCKAPIFTKGLHPKCVVADHTMNTFGSVYAQIGAQSSVLLVGRLDFSLDDSGIAWVQAGSAGYYDFYPSSTLPGVYSDETYTPTLTERNKLADADTDTACTFKDNVSDTGVGGICTSLGLFGINNELILRDLLNSGGWLEIYYSNFDASRFDIDTDHVYFYLYYGLEGGDQKVSIGEATYTGLGSLPAIVYNSSAYTECNEAGFFHTTSGDIQTDTPGNQYALGIKVVTTASMGDGTVNNQNVFALGDCLIRYYRKLDSAQSFYYVACQHEPHDPALIISQLYKDWIGLTDSDMDTTSRTAAENANVASRINITERTPLSEIVRTLSEQSTFVMFPSATGILRFIELDNTNPTVNETITRAMLVNDDFTLSKSSFIVNDMTIESRWQAEFDKYMDVDYYSDAVSQAALQKARTATYSWPNILGTAASTVAEHYVNSTNGIWSKEHSIVRFTTAGFTHSHLQVGDWIAFDSNIDAIRTNYGSSWASSKLLVIATDKSDMDTTITALKLY